MKKTSFTSYHIARILFSHIRIETEYFWIVAYLDKSKTKVWKSPTLASREDLSYDLAHQVTDLFDIVPAPNVEELMSYFRHGVYIRETGYGGYEVKSKFPNGSEVEARDLKIVDALARAVLALFMVNTYDSAAPASENVVAPATSKGQS